MIFTSNLGSSSTALVRLFWCQLACRLSTESTKRTVPFGFRQVAEDDKAKLVHNVFAKVAAKYDLMNDIMSAGLHRYWKDHFVSYLQPLCGKKRILDVAGGTGDIAFRLAGKWKGSSQVQITVLDINPHMLQVGKQRAQQLALPEGLLTWIEGDGEALPLEGGIFDAYTIAFGIRNCTHWERVLSEAYRVLRPGGHFVCLELSSGALQHHPLLRRAYDEYSFQVLPLLGQIFAADRHAYQYLVESIRKFPNQEAFKGMIEQAGFERVSYEDLAGGIATIHSGWRPVQIEEGNPTPRL